MSITEKRPKRVLVLDDEALILNMVKDMLEVLDYRCDTAVHGLEAVSMYEDAMKSGEMYCAVVVDLTLPDGISGLDAAKKILELDSDAPLIVSSGYSDEPVMANYKKYGFRAALPKPYTMMGLKEVIDDVCNKECKI